MSTEKTAHTAASEGAMKAAGQIMLWLGVHHGVIVAQQYSLAEIIDRETAAPDLLAALEGLVALGLDWKSTSDGFSAWSECEECGQSSREDHLHDCDTGKAMDAARAAIERAKGGR